MSTKIKITNKVPLPEARKVYPRLKVGQSFFVANKNHRNVSAVVAYRKRRYKEHHICRIVTVKKKGVSVKGVRVWRTK